MPAIGGKSCSMIGFLTVAHHTDDGLFGGYLLLNSAGRPVEFHCTAPVRPNRAQEILYGSTLSSYLCGEQIGQTLLGQNKVRPGLICTDVEAVLAVAEFTDLPLVLVESASQPPSGLLREFAEPIPPPHPRLALRRFQLLEQALAVLASRPADAGRAEQQLPPFIEYFDLADPFLRIRQAIAEAQRSARAA